MNTAIQKGPGLFFFVDGQWLFHGCHLNDAESYGEFLVYPHSHMDIWEQNYESIYKVDFDYFPRGRIAYRKADDTYLIYYDKCLEPVIHYIAERYGGEKIIFGYDEHYQCHMCNDYYVI